MTRPHAAPSSVARVDATTHNLANCRQLLPAGKPLTTRLKLSDVDLRLMSDLPTPVPCTTR